MADVSKLNIGDATYDLKDATARAAVGTLENNLGGLAYKSTATGSFTPQGTVSAPTISVNPTSENVSVFSNAGTLPSWSASVENETLSFSWSAGTLPSYSTKSVVTGITSATSSAPTFTGTAATISVS